MGKMIYIASPYSDDKQIVMQDRFESVAVFTARVMRDGVVAFSPIAHCHSICGLSSLPTDFQFWQRYCLVMLEKAAVLYVLMLDGWEQSIGVQAEITHAEKMGIGVCYYDDEFAMGSCDGKRN